MSPVASVPNLFDPVKKPLVGMVALTQGLPEIPESLTHDMVIPMALWTTTRCAVVLFLEYLRTPDGTFHPQAVMGTFFQSDAGWSPHKSWGGIFWSHDPLKHPKGLRDLLGRDIVPGGGRFASEPEPTAPAIVMCDRISPQVVELSLLQDGEEEQWRAVHSHFGSWVICADNWNAFTVQALNRNGDIVGMVEGPPELPERRPHGHGGVAPP